MKLFGLSRSWSYPVHHQLLRIILDLGNWLLLNCVFCNFLFQFKYIYICVLSFSFYLCIHIHIYVYTLRDFICK